MVDTVDEIEDLPDADDGDERATAEAEPEDEPRCTVEGGLVRLG